MPGQVHIPDKGSEDAPMGEDENRAQLGSSRVSGHLVRMAVTILACPRHWKRTLKFSRNYSNGPEVGCRAWVKGSAYLCLRAVFTNGSSKAYRYGGGCILNFW